MRNLLLRRRIFPNNFYLELNNAYVDNISLKKNNFQGGSKNIPSISGFILPRHAASCWLYFRSSPIWKEQLIAISWVLAPCRGICSPTKGEFAIISVPFYLPDPRSYCGTCMHVLVPVKRENKVKKAVMGFLSLN